MTLNAIDTFVTVLGTVTVETIETILRKPHDMTVQAVLVSDIPEDEITVTAVERQIAVVSVFAIGIRDRHTRDFAMEIVELIKKRTS